MESYLYLSDLIERAGYNPERVKLIRHSFSHKTFKATMIIKW